MIELNKLLFFCDIEGTLTGKDPNYNILFEKINELKELYGCDDVIFSLISSNLKYDVITMFERLNHIYEIHGKQFFCNGYFELVNNEYIIHETEDLKSKLHYIKDYVLELRNKYNLKFICYADDSIIDLMYELFEAYADNKSEIALIKPCFAEEEYSNNIIKTSREYEGLIEGLDILIKQKTKIK